MRRELVFDSRIAQAYDQFHPYLALSSSALGHWLSGCGFQHAALTRLLWPKRSPPIELAAKGQPLTTNNQWLLLFLLLALFRSRLGTLFIGLLLALLDNFGLSRSSRRFASHCLCRRRDFFLNRDDVRHGLVFVGEESQLRAVRQVGNTHDFAKHELTDIRIDLAGNVAGQALDLHLACHLLENSALLLYTHRFALENNGHHDGELLIHGDTLQIDVQQRALNRLVLPIHDHRLGALAINGKIENCVVTAGRMQNARHLAWIDADRNRVLAGAIYHSRDLPAPAHSSRFVLV